jgi:arylsulfatase A-like enzyme
LATAAEPSRPNFLVVLTDDVGWGDYRCYNPAGKIPSPKIDALARAGMRFTHAHAPAALCSPTRYSIFTGNYPWRGRTPHGTWGFDVPSHLLPEQHTIAQLLRAAGYRTAMLGKAGFGGQHTDDNGRPDFAQQMIDGPRRWGFDTSFIIPRGHQTSPLLFLEDERSAVSAAALVRGSGPAEWTEPGWDHSTVGERLLARAAQFLDEVVAANRSATAPLPFFLYVCADGAHSPYEPPVALAGEPVRGQSGIGVHGDMVYQTDVLLGRLVALLDERELLADTLVCLTSDNGGIPTERAAGHDAVGGLRGSKSEIWEGGHRVPLIIRWGDGSPAGSKIEPDAVRAQHVGLNDLAATLAELAGVAVPPTQLLDSVSLAPVLLGHRGDDRPVRATLLVQSCPGRDAFSEGDWHPDAKVLPPLRAPPGPVLPASDRMAHALYEGAWKLVFDRRDLPAALYDLATDPGERRNLVSQPDESDKVLRLEKSYRAIRASARSAELSRL